MEIYLVIGKMLVSIDSSGRVVDGTKGMEGSICDDLGESSKAFLFSRETAESRCLKAAFIIALFKAGKECLLTDSFMQLPAVSVALPRVSRHAYAGRFRNASFMHTRERRRDTRSLTRHQWKGDARTPKGDGEGVGCLALKDKSESDRKPLSRGHACSAHCIPHDMLAFFCSPASFKASGVGGEIKDAQSQL